MHDDEGLVLCGRRRVFACVSGHCLLLDVRRPNVLVQTRRGRADGPSAPPVSTLHAALSSSRHIRSSRSATTWPTAAASGGGTALPICWYRSRMAPSNSQSAGKACTAAHSLTESG